jgi:HK97 family phage portal protein
MMGIFQRAFETRSQLSNPPEWLVKLLGIGTKTAAGISVTESSALEYSPIYTAVKILAETILSLPLIYYERIGDKEKKRAVDQPLYPILHDIANPEMSAPVFREVMQGHLGTWGNGYAEIEYDGAGRIKALWPLRPDKMTPERVQGTGVLIYKYILPDWLGSKGVVLPASRVFHIPAFGFDGIMGYSPIRYNRESIGLGMGQQEYSARLFSNDARPGIVLKYGGVMNKNVKDRMREDWEEMHSGLTNKHRIAILEDGLDIKEIGFPPQETQLIESRRFSLEDAARIYRIPMHMMGDLSRSTNNNIEEQSQEFISYCIYPWLVRWEKQILLKLQTEPERKKYFAEFLVDGFLRADIEKRYKAYDIAWRNSWINADEIREKENMNPQPDGQGKKYWAPLNMLPVDMVINPELNPKAQTDPVVQTKSFRSLEGRQRIKTAYKRLFRDAVFRMLWKEKQNIPKEAERFLKESDEAGFFDWLETFYREDQDYIQRQVLPVYWSYAELIYAETAEEIGIETKLTPDFEVFIRKYVADFVVNYTKNSINEIKALKTAEEIRKLVESWDQIKPETIAQTETDAAEEAFYQETVKESGKIIKLRALN